MSYLASYIKTSSDTISIFNDIAASNTGHHPHTEGMSRQQPVPAVEAQNKPFQIKFDQQKLQESLTTGQQKIYPALSSVDHLMAASHAANMASSVTGADSIRANSRVLHQSIDSVIQHNQKIEQRLQDMSSLCCAQRMRDKQIQSDIDSIRRRNVQLQKENVQKDTQIGALRQQLEAAGDQNRFHEKIIQELTSQMSSVEEHSEMGRSLHLATKINQYSEIIQKQKMQINDMAETIARYEDEILSLKQQNNDLIEQNSKIAAITAQNAALNEQVSSLVVSSTKVQQENQNLKQELENQIEENLFTMQSMFDLFDTFQQRIREMQQELMQYEQKNMVLENEFKELSKRLISTAQNSYTADIKQVEMSEAYQTMILKYSKLLNSIKLLLGKDYSEEYSRQLELQQKLSILGRNQVVLSKQMQEQFLELINHSRAIQFRYLGQGQVCQALSAEQTAGRLDGAGEKKVKDKIIQSQQEIINDLTKRFNSFSDLIRHKLSLIEVQDFDLKLDKIEADYKDTIAQIEALSSAMLCGRFANTSDEHQRLVALRNKYLE